MIRWHLATDKQLEVIYNHDANDNCSNELLVGLITEMIQRETLDGLIVQIAKRILGVGGYDRSEVLQVGHIALYQMAKSFKAGERSFKSMCWLVIERRIKGILQVKNQLHNKMNRVALQFEVPEMLDDRNIERTVIRKFELQEQLSKLNEKERIIIELFLQGYSMRWMDTNVFNKKITYTKRHFKSALKKMGINEFKVKKGAIA